MKITRSSDWRSGLAFDTPVRVADVVPGDPARCVTCSYDTDPHERTNLWAVKQRHPHDPAGTVRFYCSRHVPQPATSAPEPSVRGRAAASGTRSSTPRRRLPDEAPALMCPECFLVVPASGVCGSCGTKIER